MDSSSSNSSQHYTNLIGTVTELRTDLEKAVSKIQNLEEQNRTFQINYQTVKDELVETRRKYNEAAQNYLSIVNEKLETDRQNDVFIEKIRLQLTEKTKEFEQIRDKFAPQDVDYIRIKVQEELEIPHRMRIQQMEQEVEKHKEAYYNMRRELERYKAEFEIYSQNQKKVLFCEREESQMIIDSLRSAITDLQNKSLITSEKDEHLRHTKVKLSELEHAYETISIDLKVAQRERDDLTYSQEQLKSRHCESILLLKTRIATLEAEKQTAEHRAATINTDVEQREILLRSARQVAEELGYEIKELKQVIHDKDIIISDFHNSQNEQFENRSLAYENERKDYLSQIDSFTTKLRDREESIRKLQRDNSELQIRSQSFDVEMRKAYVSQIQDLKQKLETHTIALAEARTVHRELETRHVMELSAHNADKEYLQSDINRLTREKETLHGKFQVVESQSETERRKNRSLVDELEMKLALSQQRLEELRNKSITSEIALAEAMKKLQQMEENYTTSLKTEGKLKVQHSEQWEELQSDIKKRYEVLAQAYKRKLQETKDKMQKSIEREKKRGDAYKARATTAHSKLKSLSAAVNAAAREFPTLLDTAEAET